MSLQQPKSMAACTRKNMKLLKSLVCLLGLYSFGACADSLSLIGGKAVDSNLIDLPIKAVKGDLKFEDHQMIGIAYQKSIAHPGFIQQSLDFVNVSGAQSNLEFMAVHHYANTPDYSLLENVLAYHIKSRPFDFNWTKITLGFSIGLSYVYGTPSFDDGSKDASNKKYRLLNYNAYEASFWNQKEDSAVFFRIHHRSGMYGLIAPEGVGSNFLTLGVKRAW